MSRCRPHKLAWCWALCIGAWFGAHSAGAEERYIHLDTAVHAVSWYSTGQAQIEPLAQAALGQGFEALILTDADVLQVEYGLPFLRNLFVFGHEEPALLTDETLGEYLEEIQRVDAAMGGLVLIDGVESRPFYYWSSILGGGPWQLRNWNKRQIAVGLGSGEAYAELPVSGGPGIWVWHWTSLLLLWPLAGVAFALLAEDKPLVVRAAIGVVSLVFLINNAPFKVPLWSADNGDLSPAPYQRYVDAVNEAGGMTFWVAPDRRETVELFGGRFGAICPPESIEADLVHTFDYTGFAALHAGRSKHAEPGQAWDRALDQYLRQERSRPVWAIGDANYRGGALAGASTVLLAKEHSRRGVLEAMRAGRMYAAMGPGGVRLEEFSIRTDRGQGGAGHHVKSGGPVQVRVRIGADAGPGQQLRVRLVRAGKVVAEQMGTTPLSFTHTGADIAPGQRVYYRLLANSQSDRLVSNPIFVMGASQ